MKKTMGCWLTILLLTGAMSLAKAGVTGVIATGDSAGGVFSNSAGSGHAFVGTVNIGISASGTTGGFFHDNAGTGSARIALSNYGIQGFGNTAGGFFKDGNASGYSYAGHGDFGISGYGDATGGFFSDLTSSSFAFVGFDTAKIQGTGTVNFVQNHPAESEQVIVYTAPEGDEVATYTRGSAVLVNGEARIPLGETFKWVTNPDIGLTAHLTPRGEGTVLYVTSITTEELVVRSMQGFPDDVAFDFIIHGLRIGFEEVSVVQEKIREAYIPAMTSHRERYINYPEFRKYNAMQRYSRMDEDMGRPVRKDMSAAQLLRKQIVEFDPAIHTSAEKPPTPAPPESIQSGG